MAQANGKLIADYLRLDSTNAFLVELSGSMGIPFSLNFNLAFYAIWIDGI